MKVCNTNIFRFTVANDHTSNYCSFNILYIGTLTNWADNSSIMIMITVGKSIPSATAAQKRGLCSSTIHIT